MQQIPCPHCGPRAQAEFEYIRSLDSIVPLDAAPDAAMATLWARDNPRGETAELWRHSYGCRQWLTLRRDTVSLVVLSATIWGAQA